MTLQSNTTALSPTDASTLALENTQLARSIDHTKLTFSPNEDEAQAITGLCNEAKTHGFYAVCVRPRHIQQAKTQLAGSPVKVAAVIGFPADKVLLIDELQHPTIGNFPTEQKVQETRQALADGSDELDLVIHVAHLKEDVKTGSQKVIAELQAIRDAANGLPIKVILETDLLTPEEIDWATSACAQTGMGMVKTSTGMVTNGQGATLDTIQRIAERLKALHASTGIKASGGIKSRKQALAFLALGVQRLGTSSGIAILQGEPVAPEAY